MSEIPNLINDLDDGMPFGRDINYYNDNKGEYLVQLITPFDLKAHIATNEFKNGKYKYPEKKKELEKLALRLQETENPVLMIVKLKK